MQLCFLYLAAAFPENKIINAYEVIQLWEGEGLLAGKMLQVRHQADGDDPFEMGGIYINHLADRCLIEPMIRDVDGRVEYLRMHGGLRDFGIRIAEQEENFYCRVDGGLTQLKKDEGSDCTRILLSSNRLKDFPTRNRDPRGTALETYSLLMTGNSGLTQIPKKVIGSMISLQVLDLSGTSLQSLPESVGYLKHLVCLRLIGTPIKRLPGSFTDLVNLRILDLSFSSIRELPYRLDKLRSLAYLGLANCKDLHYLSQRISVMTSLQHLYMNGCGSMWTEPKGFRCKNVASIQSLGGLKQLKKLELQNNSHIFNEGTLGNMREMDTLSLVLTEMERLPQDISNMSNLRKLVLECSHLVRMDSIFCDFQNMTSLILYKCRVLEELPHLHKLNSLRRMELIHCPKISKLPKEFGHREAFPLLEIFSLVGLDSLKELPKVEEDAMLSLQIFTIMECQALEIFPQSYWNLKALKKIRIFNCSKVLENLDGIHTLNAMIEVVTMPMEVIRKTIKGYLQIYPKKKEDQLYCDFLCNELFLFLKSLERPFDSAFHH